MNKIIRDICLMKNRLSDYSNDVKQRFFLFFLLSPPPRLLAPHQKQQVPCSHSLLPPLPHWLPLTATDHRWVENGGAGGGVAAKRCWWAWPRRRQSSLRSVCAPQLSSSDGFGPPLLLTHRWQDSVESGTVTRGDETFFLPFAHKCQLVGPLWRSCARWPPWRAGAGAHRNRRMLRIKSAAPDARPGASPCTWPS